MYRYHFDEDLNGFFVIHYGKFEGAEHWQAIFEILEEMNDKKTRRDLKPSFILFQTELVTEATLKDTDAAFGYYAYGRIREKYYFDSADLAKLVRILPRHSPAYEILTERGNRTSLDFEGTGKLMFTCEDLPHALQYLELDPSTKVSFKFDKNWL
ncbi:MAG: hypothetical protein ACI9FB_000531 [Candidatus Azotimanducaceae bacterium]|jgi:hypothetical protein